MSLKYQWQKRPLPNVDQREQLSSSTGLEDIVINLLLQRGIKTPSQVDKFLNPQITDLHDPYLLNDMDIAVERLTSAIFDNEKILIYGDYDADGMTSSAIMKEAIASLGGEADVFIPDRFIDGYGPNMACYQQFVADGYQLIITVDNGVMGDKEIQYAQIHDVDVIITDHHALPPKLPPAKAIVHPQYPDNKYPCPDLSGAGVAFKFATALLDELPQELLDLAAIGTIADMVSLTDENRILVKWGLKQIQTNQRLGLVKLCQQARIDIRSVDEEVVGFQIAPRLNALGRMDNATKGVELLITTDNQKSEDLAKKLEKLNQQRKKITQNVFEEAYPLALEQIKLGNRFVIVAGKNWHRGILGIVAGKITEKTNHPTVVLDIREDGQAIGSARSIDNFNIYQILATQRDLYKNFGGHAKACGITIAAADIKKWRQQINSLSEVKNLNTAKKNHQYFDLELSLEQVTTSLFKQLQQLAPFGQNNPLPIIKIGKFTSITANYLGNKTKDHIKICLQQQNKKLDVLGFNWGEELEELQKGNLEAIYGTLNENKWRKRVQIQVNLQDVEIASKKIVLKKQNFIDSRKNFKIQNHLHKSNNWVFFQQLNFQDMQKKYPQVHCFLANDLQDNIEQIVLIDRPHNLTSLKTFLQRNQQIQEIELVFYTKHPRYYELELPRKVWQTSLKYFWTHKNIGKAELPLVARYLHLTNLEIKFVLNVFSELNFVKIDRGVLIKPHNVTHQPFSKSPTYIRIQNLIDVKKKLIDSPFEEVIEYLTNN